MASETFVSAMMLITAVVACAILITAVFPIVWNMVSTFSSASHETDARMRTDFRIVATYATATAPNHGDIYLKNVGSNRISTAEIERSDVFYGKSGEFHRLAYASSSSPNYEKPGFWHYEGYDGSVAYDLNGNMVWDTGETIRIIAFPADAPASGNSVYFQFILPNSVERSEEFIVS